MKYPHLESIVLIGIFVLLMVLGPSDLFASGKRDYTFNSTATVKTDVKSAMAMATSNLHLDSRYIPLQGSVAVGSMNGVHAISFAAGKRLCKTCGLLSGSVGYEDGNVGFGSGYSFKF